MLVLLPPSETKSSGGDGPALDLDALSYPELTPTRRKLGEALSTLADDVPASLRTLGLSENQVEEVRRNAEIWDAPTVPALLRYTGVLYDALDLRSLPARERRRAQARLSVASALFGIVGGDDRIPAYRLSGNTALPGIGTLGSIWRPVLEPLLATRDELVVDLRSGAYAALAKVPEAVTVRVLSEDARGRRKVVSHHNKAHKGRLARALARTTTEPSRAEDIARVGTRAGMRIEREGPRELCVVVEA